MVNQDGVKRIFIAYRPVFRGVGVRKKKAIEKLVDQHSTSTTTTLFNEFGREGIVKVIQSLISRKAFESDVAARQIFPDLYAPPSITQAQQRTTCQEDAARSEAEALEEIASRSEAEVLEEISSFEDKGKNRDEKDDGPDEALKDDGPNETPTEVEAKPGPVVNNTGSVQLRTGISPPTNLQVKNRSGIPSLYPLRFPYSTQHFLLTTTQKLLEECCYEFSTRWMPGLLVDRQWDCPESIELNKWAHIVARRNKTLPETVFTPSSGTANTEILLDAVNIRHSSVHRLRITAERVLQMIRSAALFSHLLQDGTREQLFEELVKEVETKIRTMELHKNFLESRTERELHEIARLRRELDEREKEAVATAHREDKDHVHLVGEVLTNAAQQILLASCDDATVVADGEKVGELSEGEGEGEDEGEAHLNLEHGNSDRESDDRQPGRCSEMNGGAFQASATGVVKLLGSVLGSKWIRFGGLFASTAAQPLTREPLRPLDGVEPL